MLTCLRMVRVIFDRSLLVVLMLGCVSFHLKYHSRLNADNIECSMPVGVDSTVDAVFGRIWRARAEVSILPPSSRTFILIISVERIDFVPGNRNASALCNAFPSI